MGRADAGLACEVEWAAGQGRGGQDAELAAGSARRFDWAMLAYRKPIGDHAAAVMAARVWPRRSRQQSCCLCDANITQIRQLEFWADMHRTACQYNHVHRHC